MRSQHSQTSQDSRTVSPVSQPSIGSGPRFGIALKDLDGRVCFILFAKVFASVRVTIGASAVL